MNTNKITLHREIALLQGHHLQLSHAKLCTFTVPFALLVWPCTAGADDFERAAVPWQLVGCWKAVRLITWERLDTWRYRPGVVINYINYWTLWIIKWKHSILSCSSCPTVVISLQDGATGTLDDTMMTHHVGTTVSPSHPKKAHFGGLHKGMCCIIVWCTMAVPTSFRCQVRWKLLWSLQRSETNPSFETAWSALRRCLDMVCAWLGGSRDLVILEWGKVVDSWHKKLASLNVVEWIGPE